MGDRPIQPGNLRDAFTIEVEGVLYLVTESNPMDRSMPVKIQDGKIVPLNGEETDDLIQSMRAKLKSTQETKRKKLFPFSGLFKGKSK